MERGKFSGLAISNLHQTQVFWFYPGLPAVLTTSDFFVEAIKVSLFFSCPCAYRQLCGMPYEPIKQRGLNISWTQTLFYSPPYNMIFQEWLSKIKLFSRHSIAKEVLCKNKYVIES